MIMPPAVISIRSSSPLTALRATTLPLRSLVLMFLRPDAAAALRPVALEARALAVAVLADGEQRRLFLGDDHADDLVARPQLDPDARPARPGPSSGPPARRTGSSCRRACPG